MWCIQYFIMLTGNISLIQQKLCENLKSHVSINSWDKKDCSSISGPQKTFKQVTNVQYDSKQYITKSAAKILVENLNLSFVTSGLKKRVKWSKKPVILWQHYTKMH